MRILYLSYFFPPLGGPASIRNAKTVKYLQELGATVDVITVTDIEYNTYDASLEAETGSAKIFRAASWDLMSLLKKLSSKGKVNSQEIYFRSPENLKRILRGIHPIDDKIGWVYPAWKMGKDLLKQNIYDLIYVSCGPFSSALAAYYLAKSSGIPFVIDYRDYWTLLSDYERDITFLHKYLAQHWEKRILSSASLIVTATKGIGRDLCKQFGSWLQNKMLTVYNGWDERDFAGTKELNPVVRDHEKPFTIAYFGVIYARRSLKHLLEAMHQLMKENRIPAGITLDLYGNYYPETISQIETSGIAASVRIHTPLPHREALIAMQKADLLLLLINSSSPYGTLTSKIFEYLRSTRPILALAPAQGEAAELLNACGHEYICAMESTSAIADTIELAWQQKDNPRAFTNPAEFERSHQLKSLYQRLETLFSVLSESS